MKGSGFVDKFTFGNRLHELRTQNNLTQKELAKMMIVSESAQNNIIPSNKSAEGAITLSATDLSIIKSELQFRFSKEHDWSKIS